MSPQLLFNSYPSHLLAMRSLSQNSELLSAADKLLQRESYKILYRCCQQLDLDWRSLLKGGIYGCPNDQPVTFPILSAASEKRKETLNGSFCNTCWLCLMWRWIQCVISHVLSLWIDWISKEARQLPRKTLSDKKKLSASWTLISAKAPHK